MKKFTILTLSALMVFAFALPVSALENVFGGYWQTRIYAIGNFSGQGDDAGDASLVDSRTRLDYTAILNENLKLVNSFEFNMIWGDNPVANTNPANLKSGYWGAHGRIGTSDNSILVKYTYADFNLGPTNFKIGAQPLTLARGFLFDEDFAGAIITYKGETFEVPFIWIKAYEGLQGDNTAWNNGNDMDVDYYAVAPSFDINEMLTLTPYVMYITTDDINGNSGTLGWVSSLGTINPITKFDLAPTGQLKADLYYVGCDADINLGAASLWFTGIYEFGHLKEDGATPPPGVDQDFKAWLIAAGGNMEMEFGNIHGQLFYATGNDNDNDSDIEAFYVPAGQSYYWSEIMGCGIFDDFGYNNVTYYSNGSPGDQISNIVTFNLGTTYMPMDKLSLDLDVWHARLVEDDINGEDQLGTEVDVKITYELMEGLNIDIVGAYLFAGDATTGTGTNDEDPYEFGTRLSLSF